MTSARLSLWLAWAAAIIAAAAIPVASLSYRLGLVPQIRSMFVSFQVALIAAALCLAFGLAAAWINRRAGWRRIGLGLLPFIAAILVLAPLIARWDQARAAARIHDISTDTVSPPAFQALLEVRKETGRNPSEYDPAAAPLQEAAYPDIKPVVLERPREEAFDRALAAAQAMGWEIAVADKPKGHIEATATTPWFRFKDDVVIRVEDAGAGKSRIDVRSVSRIGGGDLGQNAQRVRAYVARLSG
jgi:uncharacterized protein (DUF1499 family)